MTGQGLDVHEFGTCFEQARRIGMPQFVRRHFLIHSRVPPQPLQISTRGLASGWFTAGLTRRAHGDDALVTVHDDPHEGLRKTDDRGVNKPLQHREKTALLFQPGRLRAESNKGGTLGLGTGLHKAGEGRLDDREKVSYR